MIKPSVYRIIRCVAVLSFLLLAATNARAIQLDWSGQFWFDNHWLNNYQLDRSRPAYDNDPELVNGGGPYVPGAGSRNVIWYTSFLRLKPKIVVNDSINIKTEFHVGSPISGFFGRGYPRTTDESLNFTGSQKEGAAITAQRFWANLITDFGTVEFGRAPIHWGLGAIWNSGDNLFDRYQSTGDMVRITSKFGNFWLMPSLTKVAVGDNVAGAQDAAGNTVQGDDDVTDVNLAAKYDNSEEDFEFGLMWTHRAGNIAQRTVQYNNLAAGGANMGSQRISYNIYDFYAKKRMGRYSLGGELPLFSGSLGAIDGAKEFDYKSYALILEANYTSDLWDLGLKFGHVPGQPSSSASAGQTAGQVVNTLPAGDTTFRAVYLNKDYGLGLIMFHYNLYGLSNNNPDTKANAGLRAPYGAPIVNANYAAFLPQMKFDKWTLKGGIILGYANEAASASKNFFNYNQRRFYNAIGNQSKFLGKEFDFGISFKWDENFLLAWDLGMWFPGEYYAFSNNNALKQFDMSMMFASQVRAGISF